ncbi:MAG: hypothetical protein K2K41_05505 [Ruminiclostridium sp.]|nr:hypothetical protein [Ruminiclostridium sp.]
MNKDTYVNLNDPLKVHTIGLKALQDALGSVGLVRFIQQFDSGKGNYTEEKQNAQDLSLDEIEALLKSSK